MKLKTYTNDSDTLIKLLEYAKKNEINGLIDTIDYIQSAGKLSVLNYLLFQNPNERMLKSIKFLGELEPFSSDINIENGSMKKILREVENFPEKLEKYLETAKVLKEKGISKISFTESYHNFELFFEKPGVISDMYKTYSNGEISNLNCIRPSIYSDISYKPSYNVDATFILTVENHYNRGDSYRYLWLKSLDFDASKLPTEEEMASKRYPKEFMDYLDSKDRERLEEIFANQTENVKTLK